LFALRSTLQFLCALVATALLLVESRGATFVVDSRKIPGLTAKSTIVTNTIRLSGPIEEGDAEKLRTILNRLKAESPPEAGRPLATIELSSSGGDVYEGLKLGYLFREYTVTTLVRSKDLCLSSCALAFLGGTSRRLEPQSVPGRSIEIGGQVGFHSFYLNTGSAQIEPGRDPREGMVKGFSMARGGASALMRYAATMGVDAGFVARLLARSPEEWEYIDTDQQFVALQACPIGLGLPRLSPQAFAANICNHSTGWIGAASPSQARQLSPRDARRHMLEQVQGNIEAFSGKGPLVTQLKAVLAVRDDLLVEGVYNDLRTAGIALPELLGSFFEVSGYSSGPYQIDCHVTFSRDNPSKFSVSLQTPEGLVKPFQSPPANCPALFLYDRDDVLNPGR